LPESWLRHRELPLSYSFCQRVVTGAAPLVVEDARTDPRAAGDPAVTELGVVGYAGMPLTDGKGRVLGSLCAIDIAPRRWPDSELALLADLAAACCDILQLRITARTAQRHEDRAHAQRARADAAFDRSQLLLRASVALAGTAAADEVVNVVRDLVRDTLDPAYVGLWLVDRAGRLRLQPGPALSSRIAARWDGYPATAATPPALAVRVDSPVLLPDLDAVRALTADAGGTFPEMGWQAAASLPLPGPDGPIGALTFAWTRPYALDEAEQAVLAALAGYVAQALLRANYLFARENAATVLQRALLPELPDAAPFELAARYGPATRGEQVGGDWYDAVRLEREHLALVAGDVTGHDIGAAALMGRVRSKLRLLLVDRNEPPAALLRRLETANKALGDQITATAVLAFLRPDTGAAGGHLLHWSNAGHPSPLLVTDTGITVLGGHDPLLGATRRTARTSHTRHLPPGATVLFYTDGLIETRRQPIDERERQLYEAVARLAHQPLPQLLDQLYTELAGHDHEDDVAMLAVRTPRQ
jgi:serine phosphatase RsbU (regulator of sigma subunit)